MKTNRLIKSALIVAAAAVFSSCYYDPSYGGYGTSYGTTGVSASFVSTSSDYWFYDPAVRCYYDRRRSCYYDPYLYGYYPRGYTPRPISNCPHPYGWGGRGYAPVPNRVNGRTLNQHQDRVSQLQARNYAWANQVRVRNDANVARWQRNQANAAANYRGNQHRAQQPARNQGPNLGQPPGRNPGQQGNWNQPQRNPGARQPESPPRQQPIVTNNQTRRQTNVEVMRERNAQFQARAQQNLNASRERAAAVQAQRQSNLKAAQDAQRQRLEDVRNRRNIN